MVALILMVSGGGYNLMLSCVELLKHTPEEHLDHNSLMKVVEVIKSILV